MTDILATNFFHLLVLCSLKFALIIHNFTGIVVERTRSVTHFILHNFV